MRDPAFEMVVAAVIVREKTASQTRRDCSPKWGCPRERSICPECSISPDARRVAGNNAIRHRGGDTPGSATALRVSARSMPEETAEATTSKKSRRKTGVPGHKPQSSEACRGNVAHAVRRVHHRRGFIRRFLNAKQRHHVAVIAGGKLVIKLLPEILVISAVASPVRLETNVVVHH